ncbi:MAG: dihydropyrimidinase [Elusimicrobia bacterium]|nr:dihydropyrimidinase [Elusimicrobiota bacterium]
MSFDLIIKGGKAVIKNRAELCDIFVKNGKIARIKKPSKNAIPAGRIIDARGLLVLPGIIDAHAHFRLRLGPGRYTADDFITGSAAAACGGVTTFIDYTGQGPGENLVKGLNDRIKGAAGRAYSDFSFHCMLTGWDKLKKPAAQMAAVVKAGVPTFKMFTAYGARGLMAGDAALFSALETAKKLGALICVHAENGPIIDLLTERYAGTKGIKALPLSHPAFTETEAVGRVSVLAAAASAPVYFVHLSAGGSANIVKAARAAGLSVMGETCPQYLVLNDLLFKGKNGHLYSCCPPLRTKADNAALWRAAAAGELQVIATDNCTFTRAQKNAWGGDIRKLPMGLPGSQTLLAAVYTFGVKAGKIKIERLVEMLCENPARITGLYPRKGVISPGSDADFAIIDPKAGRKADWRTMSHNTDYSPWQGMKLYGFPKYTILRGKVIAQDGKLTTPKTPTGKFQRRMKPEIV